MHLSKLYCARYCKIKSITAFCLLIRNYIHMTNSRIMSFERIKKRREKQKTKTKQCLCYYCVKWNNGTERERISNHIWLYLLCKMYLFFFCSNENGKKINIYKKSLINLRIDRLFEFVMRKNLKWNLFSKSKNSFVSIKCNLFNHFFIYLYLEKKVKF